MRFKSKQTVRQYIFTTFSFHTNMSFAGGGGFALHNDGSQQENACLIHYSSLDASLIPLVLVGGTQEIACDDATSYGLMLLKVCSKHSGALNAK